MPNPKLLLMLTETQRKALQSIKRQDGVPMGEFIRRAIDKALAERSPTSPRRPEPSGKES